MRAGVREGWGDKQQSERGEGPVNSMIYVYRYGNKLSILIQVSILFISASSALPLASFRREDILIGPHKAITSIFISPRSH